MATKAQKKELSDAHIAETISTIQTWAEGMGPRQGLVDLLKDLMERVAALEQKK